jgi:hypothetical protein
VKRPIDDAIAGVISCALTEHGVIEMLHRVGHEMEAIASARQLPEAFVNVRAERNEAQIALEAARVSAAVVRQERDTAIAERDDLRFTLNITTYQRDSALAVAERHAALAVDLAAAIAERDRLRGEAVILVANRRTALDRVVSDRRAFEAQIAGLVGLLERIHPLAALGCDGDDEEEIALVREIAAATANRGDYAYADRLLVAETRAENAEKRARSRELELEGVRAALNALEDAVGGPEHAAEAVKLDKELAAKEDTIAEIIERIRRVDECAEAVRKDPENPEFSDQFSAAFAAMRRAAGIV